MNILDKLYKYRDRYINREEDKINSDYIRFLSEIISELEDLQDKILQEEKLLKLLDILFDNLSLSYSRNLRDYIKIPDEIYNDLLTESIGKDPPEIIKLFELYYHWEARLYLQIEDIKRYKSWNIETRELWKKTLSPKEREPYEMADSYDISIIEEYFRSKYVRYIKRVQRHDDTGSRPTA